MPETESEVEPVPDRSGRVRFGVRAGDICRRARSRSQRSRGSLGLEPGQTRCESLEQVAALARQEGVIRREALRRLRALDAPTELRLAFERYLGGLEQLVVQTDGLASAAADGDSARARELSRQIRLGVRRNRRLAAAARLGRCAS